MRTIWLSWRRCDRTHWFDAADSKWLPIEQMLTLLKPMIHRSAKKAEVDCCDGYLKRKGILAATSQP